VYLILLLFIKFSSASDKTIAKSSKKMLLLFLILTKLTKSIAGHIGRSGGYFIKTQN
jgi:hypothetical protein